MNPDRRRGIFSVLGARVEAKGAGSGSWGEQRICPTMICRESTLLYRIETMNVVVTTWPGTRQPRSLKTPTDPSRSGRLAVCCCIVNHAGRPTRLPRGGPGHTPRGGLRIHGVLPASREDGREGALAFHPCSPAPCNRELFPAFPPNNCSGPRTAKQITQANRRYILPPQSLLGCGAGGTRRGAHPPGRTKEGDSFFGAGENRTPMPSEPVSGVGW